MKWQDGKCIRQATGEEQTRLLHMLEEAGLPTSDLQKDPDTRFLVAATDDTILGCVGIEFYGSLVLIRSLAVSATLRNQGIGSNLLRAAEEFSYDHGARHAYLLTVTAEEFFRRRGYSRVERTLTPLPIASSAEYSSVCPSSAVLMTRHI